MDESGKPNLSQQTSPDLSVRKPAKPAIWQKRPVILTGTLLLAFVLVFSLRYLVESFTHESTDDAFLDATFASIAPRVSGQVSAVPVQDNQEVKAGDLLVSIDPRDLQMQLDQKQAAVAAAQANSDLITASLTLLETEIATAQATAKQTEAEAAASDATAQKADADLRRAESLIQNHTISPQEYDATRAAAAAAQANLKAAREKAASDASKVAQARAQFESGRKALARAEAQTRQAEVDVKAAELNLSYARVTAPVDGRVTRKSVQAGDYLQAGQKMMALVPRELFVTANFKETQLQHIRTNQPVRITIDSISGPPLSGRVDSIQAGSGARFSLLPPENAVGNFVKVVQRVPVKIVFDKPLNAGHVLGPGMSVVPSIHVADYEIQEEVITFAAIVLALLLGLVWWLAASRGTSRRD